MTWGIEGDPRASRSEPRAMMNSMRMPLVVAAVLAATASMGAQAPAGRPPGPAGGQRLRGPVPIPEGGVAPAEIQRMFDAYALLQAQERLHISDEQFPPFLSRFKALQEA